jgi:hypothetical protein
MSLLMSTSHRKKNFGRTGHAGCHERHFHDDFSVELLANACGHCFA